MILLNPLNAKPVFGNTSQKSLKLENFNGSISPSEKNSSMMFLWTPKNKYGEHQSVVQWSQKKEQLDRFFEWKTNGSPYYVKFFMNNTQEKKSQNLQIFNNLYRFRKKFVRKTEALNFFSLKSGKLMSVFQNSKLFWPKKSLRTRTI